MAQIIIFVKLTVAVSFKMNLHARSRHWLLFAVTIIIQKVAACACSATESFHDFSLHSAQKLVLMDS